MGDEARPVPADLGPGRRNSKLTPRVYTCGSHPGDGGGSERLQPIPARTYHKQLRTTARRSDI
jgi:hypothetical protein